MFGRIRLEHQILALIRRVGAKVAKCKARRTRDRFGHQITWVDGLYPLHQRKRVFAGRDRYEQALVRVDWGSDSRFDGRIRRRQPWPQIRKVDAFMGTRPSLDAHSDRRWLNVEGGS